MSSVPGTENGKPYVRTVDSLADVGTLVDLSPEGWGTAGSTQGCNGAADGYNRYNIGDYVLVRAATSYIFAISKGTVTAKIAVLIGTMSAGGGSSITGDIPTYFVDSNYPAPPPPAAGVRGPWPTIAGALAQVAFDGTTLATVIIARGSYAESPVLEPGISLVGMNGTDDAGVEIVGAISVNPATVGGVSIPNGLANLKVSATGAPAFSATGLNQREIHIEHCTMERTDAGLLLDLQNTAVASFARARSSSLLANSSTSDAIITELPLTLRECKTVGIITANNAADLFIEHSDCEDVTPSTKGATINDSTIGSGLGSAITSTGGTIILHHVTARCLDAVTPVIDAPVATVVEFADLELINGGRVFDPTQSVTHNVYPGSRANVVSVQAAPVALLGDDVDVLRVNAGAAGPQVVNLPDIGGLQQGRILMIRNDRPGAIIAPLASIVLTPAAGDTIDGNASQTLYTGEGILLVADRANNRWSTISGVFSSTGVGANLKYVVYPPSPAFVNPPSGVFTSVADAISAATEQAAGTPVLILLAPGDHLVGPGTLQLNDGNHLVGLGDQPSATRIVGPGGIIAAVTTPPGTLKGTRVSFTNLEIDDAGGNAALAYDDTGVPTGDTFVTASRLSVLGDVLGTGVNVVPSFTARDSTLGGDLLLTATGGSADLTDTSVAGNTSTNGGLTCNGVELFSVTSNGALTARGSTRFSGTLNADGAATLDDCIVGADSSFSGGITARFTSFAETITLASPGATTSLFDACSIVTTAGDGLSVGGSDVATLVNTSIRANSGIACSGAGAVIIVGSLPGGGTVTVATATTVSAQVGHLLEPVTLTGTGAPGDAWPATNPDCVLATSIGLAASNILQLPPANTQVPGRILIVRNVGAANSMTLTVALGSGDALFDSTVSGDITLAPANFRQVICLRSGTWYVIG